MDRGMVSDSKQRQHGLPQETDRRGENMSKRLWFAWALTTVAWVVIFVLFAMSINGL